MSENLGDSRTLFRGELAERFSETQKGGFKGKSGGLSSHRRQKWERKMSSDVGVFEGTGDGKWE
jgi:hypothetical protein